MPSNADAASRIALGTLLNNYSSLYDSNVGVTVIKSDGVEDSASGTKTCTANVRSGTGGVYTVTVKTWKDRSGGYTLASPCKVDCNCRTYIFRNNELLDRYGAALQVRYVGHASSGPNAANPGNVVTCCKHIYGYISYLLRRGDMRR